MNEAELPNVFPSPCMWAGEAHRQKMPLDVPAGPHRGEIANVLAFRHRTGMTEVTVTWPVEDQVGLSTAKFEYASPREALEAGWELGKQYEADAAFMERIARR